MTLAPRLTPADLARITAERRDSVPWATIAARLGRNADALSRAYHKAVTASVVVPAPARQTEAVTAKPRPASAGARVGKSYPSSANVVERVMIWPDTHVPYECPKAFAVALAAASAFKPHRIILLGDFADFYSVSSHPKSPDRAGGLQAEVDAVNAALDKIAAIGAAVTYLCGNHEWRLERFLCAKAPELFGMVEASRLFRVKERGWTWVPYMQSIAVGKLHLTHDVGHCGMNAHRLTRQAFEGNSAIGHTHRLAVEYVGSVKGAAHVGAMLGWLGDKSQIDYMHAAKASAWQHGFGLAYHEIDTGNVHLVPVPIIDGRCIVEGRLVSA